MKKTLEELLQTPYWIIDILPERVPKDSPGQYFAIEKYFLREERLAEIKQKHVNLLLKLNCFCDISLDKETSVNPPPEQIADAVIQRCTYIKTGNSMLLSEPDDTHMTLFNPDEKLLSLIKTLAAAEGLFVWQPRDASKHDEK